MADYSDMTSRTTRDRLGQPTTSERAADLARGAEDMASQAAERAKTLASELGETIRERPYTTLAVVAGLAFTLGAVWKLGRHSPSRLESLMAQLPDLPSRDRLMRYLR
jgi:hypothetical protein